MAGGTVFKGSDGSLYFIRDEILAASKVEGEYRDRLDNLLGGSEVEGFSLDAQEGVEGSSGSVSSEHIAAAPVVASTIMCPW